MNDAVVRGCELTPEFGRVESVRKGMLSVRWSSGERQGFGPRAAAKQLRKPN